MDDTPGMLTHCAICGEENAGATIPFLVVSPEGRAGSFVTHAACMLRVMHPNARALWDASPVLGGGESPGAIEYINAESHGTLAFSISLYPRDDLARDSAEVHEFFADARRRLVAGMSMAGGPQKQEIPPGMAVPLVTFTFGPENVPEPLWEIREWLVSHPLARLIEVESHLPDRLAS